MTSSELPTFLGAESSTDLMSLLPLATAATPVSQLFIVVHVMLGLCNRLRAYASAHALAEATGRKLAVIWVPDVHCNTEFSDLFETPENVWVLNSFDEKAVSARADVEWFNVVQTSQRTIENSTSTAHSHLFVRSGTVFFGRHLNIKQSALHKLPSQSSAEGKACNPICFLRRSAAGALQKLNPVEQIRKDINVLSSQLYNWEIGGKQRASSILGIHVRMWTNMSTDTPGIEKASGPFASLDAMKGAVKSRSACDWHHFVAPARRVLAELSKPAVVYVVTDTPGVAESLCGVLIGGATTGRTDFRCVTTPTTLTARCDLGGSARRGPACVKVALTELLLLSRATSMLHIIGSSFSEIASTILRQRSEVKQKVTATKTIVRSGCAGSASTP